MVTRTTPEIDWSTFPDSDGEPMAETSANAIQMVDLQWMLQTLFDLQGRLGTTTVGGNQFVYYNRYNGRDNISPDVYVIFDRTPPAPPSWKTWVQGKFPDIVFEITSSSTRAQDLSEAPRGKRTLYAELGAKEYYIYDPQQETEPPFLGFESRGGRMEPLPALSSGGVMSLSLGAELRPVAMGQTEWRPAGTWLRVIDPRTNKPIALTDELYRDFAVEHNARVEAERARVEAERARGARRGDAPGPVTTAGPGGLTGVAPVRAAPQFKARPGWYRARPRIAPIA